MRRRWQFETDSVAGADLPVGDHDPHDTRFSDQGAVSVAVQHGGGQARQKVVQLRAGITQSGDLHDRRIAQKQTGAGRQGQQVDSACGDIFTHLTGTNRQIFVPQFRWLYPEEQRTPYNAKE